MDLTIDEDEESGESGNISIARALVSPTPSNDTYFNQPSSSTTLRNEPIRSPLAYVDSCDLDGITIRPGDTVELMLKPGESSGDFLKVTSIIEDLETEEITLRGLRLRRNKFYGPMLGRKRNEVCMDITVDRDDARAFDIQGQEDVSLAAAFRKRNLLVTNKPYPQLSLLRHEIMPDYDTGLLICRWVHLTVHRSTAYRHDGRRHRQGVLRAIDRSEASPRPKDVIDLISDDEFYRTTKLERLTRKVSKAGTFESILKTEKTESYVPNMSHSHKRSRSPGEHLSPSRTPTFSTRKRARISEPKKQVKYTFGDCFCGAGGASQGAQNAGLTVTWGVDKEAAACETWMANFPRADCYEYAIEEFLDHTGALKLYVDILHLSPPCQFWSPAHTNEGKDDEANEAALYTVGKIIKTVRPRIVTLEQTLGLFTHHPTAFYQLVDMIKSAGYNVSYLAADFAEYGLVQARNRLVIIAAK